MRKIFYISLFSLVLLCSACTPRTIYSSRHNLPLAGWDADTVVTFCFLPDTIAAYDLLLFMRHTNLYPYQNIWLEVNIDSTLTDTIEFYLADQRGQWLGSHNGRLYEMPVLYKSNYRFMRNDSCSLSIRHLMRDERLKGVSDIGLTVQQSQTTNNP